MYLHGVERQVDSLADKQTRLSSQLTEVCMFFVGQHILFSLQTLHRPSVISKSAFGSFGLSTKEPYTIMHCPLLASASSSVHTSPATWLDIETSYLVYICTYVPHIYAYQVFSDSDV